jgi:hypothetical protein
VLGVEVRRAQHRLALRVERPDLVSLHGHPEEVPLRAGVVLGMTDTRAGRDRACRDGRAHATRVDAHARVARADPLEQAGRDHDQALDGQLGDRGIGQRLERQDGSRARLAEAVLRIGRRRRGHGERILAGAVEVVLAVHGREADRALPDDPDADRHLVGGRGGVNVVLLQLDLDGADALDEDLRLIGTSLDGDGDAAIAEIEQLDGSLHCSPPRIASHRMWGPPASTLAGWPLPQ